MLADTLRRHALLACGRVVLALAVAPQRAEAHDGPPIAVAIDAPVACSSVSLWADPDVGTGTFFLKVAPRDPNAGRRTQATLWVEPAERQRPAIEQPFDVALADSEPMLRASVLFDEPGPWRVRLALRVDDCAGELTRRIDVTGPGGGPWSLVWYAAPFLGLGALWMRKASALHPPMAR